MIMPNVNPVQACLLAKVSDCTYFIGTAGGVTSCPVYGDVGFTASPATFMVGADKIDAALVGTTTDAVVLAFRGTLPLTDDSWDDFLMSALDWLNDGDAVLISVNWAKGQVHKGFARSLDALWPQVLAEVKARMTATGLPLVITGHSKGGGLANLAAIRMKNEAGITSAAVLTYASPRSGDQTFADDYNTQITSHWRYENEDDIVPHLPPTSWLLKALAQETMFSNLTSRAYVAVGTLEFLNWEGGITVGDSSFLDIERRLHLIAVIATGKIKELAGDHSLANEYMPKICGS
jgi:Lipase (class 3)